MGISTNTVQTVGDLDVVLTHPAVNNGAETHLTGFKLEDTFLDAVQEMDNSKRVALVGGGSVAITNLLRIGKLTLTGLRTQGDAVKSAAVTSGDLILCAQKMQGSLQGADKITSQFTDGDSTGGTLKISYSGQGGTQTYTFLAVTLVSVPALKIAGNDVPTYPVVFGYADYEYNFKGSA